MLPESLLLALLLGAALFTRPWRLLAHQDLLTPLLAALALLPWLWALPRLWVMPLQVQWSGACLLVLLVGWPLAVPALVLVALLAALVAPTTADVVVAQALWTGAVPATLALLLGALIRRYIGAYPFVYVLGRGFLGTVACTFVAGALAQWAGHQGYGTDPALSMVARWLMAWGDGFTTGMVAAIFVAYRPQWLATWSDRLYLPPKPPGV